MYISSSQIKDIKHACAMINDASDILVAIQCWFENRTNDGTANADAAAATLSHSIWNACDALHAFIENIPDYEQL